MTYFWVYKCNQDFFIHELEICQKTIVDWYNYAREVCVSILERKSDDIIGGPGTTVKIDRKVNLGKGNITEEEKLTGCGFSGVLKGSPRSVFFSLVLRTEQPAHL